MEISKFFVTKTHQEVADVLRQRIRAGEVPVGSRLPTQRELANSFGVSRQSIRDALYALEEEGLIAIRRGATGGSFVSRPQLTQRGIRRWVRTNLVDLDDICDFRIAVEQQAASLAAQRRTPEDLASMRQAIEALPTDDDSPLDVFREADGRFHAAITRAARNPRIEQAVRKARSDLFIPADAIDFKHEVETTRREHLKIHQAIVDQDSATAVACVVSHIEETRRVLRALLTGTA